MVHKHCKLCGLDIEDTMGVWKCYSCGGDLVEGYSGQRRDIRVMC